MLKKILCLLLTGLVLTSTVACGTAGDGSETTSPSTSAAAEEDTGPTPELPEVSYNGEPFRILTGETNYTYFVAEETNGEMLNDAIVTANMYVTEQFNITLERVNGSADTYIQAGDDAYDVAYQHDIDAANFALRGWFKNVYDMPYMDPTAPWWPQFTVESLTVNGKMFFFSNYTGYLGMAQTRVCFFNRSILENNQMEAPYDYVRDGTWTLDKIMEMSTEIYSDMNGNGRPDEADLFGYASCHYPWGWLEAFGIELYQKESPTSAEMNVVVDDRCHVLIDKLHEWWYTGDDSVWITLEGHGEPGISMFADNRVAFTFATHLADQVRPALDNDVPYGIVPYPKISASEENYYGACTDFLFTIPLTVRDDERVGAILEAMAYSGYKYVRPAYCEQTLQTRFATDPDCAEMLNLIFDNRVISFAYLYSDIQSDLIAKTVVNKNVASFIRAYARVEQKALEKKVCKIFRDE